MIKRVRISCVDFDTGNNFHLTFQSVPLRSLRSNVIFSLKIVPKGNALRLDQLFYQRERRVEMETKSRGKGGKYQSYGYKPREEDLFNDKIPDKLCNFPLLEYLSFLPYYLVDV